MWLLRTGVTQPLPPPPLLDFPCGYYPLLLLLAIVWDGTEQAPGPTCTHTWLLHKLTLSSLEPGHHKNTNPFHALCQIPRKLCHPLHSSIMTCMDLLWIMIQLLLLPCCIEFTLNPGTEDIICANYSFH